MFYNRLPAKVSVMFLKCLAEMKVVSLWCDHLLKGITLLL